MCVTVGSCSVRVVVVEDSAGTPGRCVRAKNLTPCVTIADCSDAGETCSPLDDNLGQSYCLPTSTDDAEDLQQMLEVQAPGGHQAYSRPLAVYGMYTSHDGLCL